MFLRERSQEKKVLSIATLMHLYKKKKINLHVIFSTDMGEIGESITLNTLEGDVEINVDESNYVMIGAADEVYPISKALFDSKFALWKDNRFFDSLSKKLTKQIAEQLLKNGKANLKKCRSVKTGKTYDTTIILSVNDVGQAQFTLDFSR